jgi:hypothetical protein
MGDNVETENLSQTEFSLLDTSSMNLFPDPRFLIRKTKENEGQNTYWVLALRALSSSLILPR